MRVGVGGCIFFLERFRDGTYVDLLEVCTYTLVRRQSNSGGEREEPRCRLTRITSTPLG